MRGLVFVPYVGAYPEAAVDALGQIQYGRHFYWEATIQEIGPEHHAYADKLNELWTLCLMAKTDLMVIEGDVVIHDQVFGSFAACDNDYCVFTYWIGASYGYGLGCTRFRTRLIQENPDLIRKAGQRTNDGLPIADHFKRMDTRIRDEARDRGLLKLNDVGDPSPCVHWAPVKHLHVYPMPEPEGNEHEAGRRFVDEIGG